MVQRVTLLFPDQIYDKLSEDEFDCWKDSRLELMEEANETKEMVLWVYRTMHGLIISAVIFAFSGCLLEFVLCLDVLESFHI